MVEDGFKQVRDIIVLASKSKKPSDQDFGKIVQPLSALFGKITEYKDKRRNTDYYNHEYAVDEGIKCLAWVTVTNTPVAYTKEMVNAAQFYNNKVLVAYKTKDKRHVDFVNQFKNAIEELAAYIKEHHTTGLKWNPKGGDWQSASAPSSAPKSAPSSGGPPPPPPGPPPAVDLSSDAPSSGGGNADLFASINQLRDNAGSGLRKVKAEEKTKNRKEEDKVHTVSLASKQPIGAPKSGTGKKALGPPKFELVQGMGEKWLIENQQSKHDLVITETKVKQGVYILNCRDTLVTVKGKVNGIVIDSCIKTAVIFDDAVSSCETVNSSGIKMQVNGRVPTINVDKTDGVQIFLSNESIATSIITSKSSEMNVCIPNKAGDDYDEIVIPEQFESKWNPETKKLDTTMVTLNL